MNENGYTSELFNEDPVNVRDTNEVEMEPPADLTFDEKSEEEVGVDTSSTESVVDDEWLKDYVTATEAHLQNLRALIKYTKTKDESIYKLSNELQKYREDYCSKTFKPIGMAIISFREDCRKSVVDIAKYAYDAEKVKKYLEFLADDYFEMLSNVGIEDGDDGWLFNGSPIRETAEGQTLTFVNPFVELPVEEIPVDDYIPSIKTTEQLLAYLKSVEDEIKDLLGKNEILDKCLKAYVEFSFNLEKDIVKVLVLPSVRTLISVGNKLRTLVNDVQSDLTDENCNEGYAKCLDYIIGALEDVLYSGGIIIDATGREMFDPKKDRLLKTVMTEDETLDRKIAVAHTECYIMNDKVIYPSKVDVYKLAPKTVENENKGE